MAVALRLLIAWFALGWGALIWAGPVDDIRARMAERKPAIEALKVKKILGENNRGYLEPRHSVHPEQEKLMSDENDDRRELYKAIAGEKGSRMEQVGREHAHENNREARRGTWVQDEYGEWFVKT